MLVLSRKTTEGILIDGDIRIHVLKIRGNTIRLGIDAPSQVSIRRSELEPLEPLEPHSVHAKPHLPEFDQTEFDQTEFDQTEFDQTRIL